MDLVNYFLSQLSCFSETHVPCCKVSSNYNHKRSGMIEILLTFQIMDNSRCATRLAWALRHKMPYAIMLVNSKYCTEQFCMIYLKFVLGIVHDNVCLLRIWWVKIHNAKWRMKERIPTKHSSTLFLLLWLQFLSDVGSGSKMFHWSVGSCVSQVCLWFAI